MPTLAEYPHLVAQLDPRKNGPLAPESITYASNRKLWWRCPEGPDHVWAATVSHRTTRGDGCPFCSNKAVSVTNALSKLAPAVARQWHPTRNGDLRPRDVVAGSHRKVWWKCPKGPDHEWCVTVENRAVTGYGCPFCAGKRATSARNLAVVAPHLLREWHPTANGALRPEEVTPRSRRKLWWRCSEGPDHVWAAIVADRTGGAGCPFCSGHALSATNALSKVAPAVAREWHPTRNGDLRPRDVVAGSHRRLWWKCPKGPDHEWQATVDARSNGGYGCPFCSGRRATAARNVAVVAPHLVSEWHPTRNGDVRPEDVTPRSSRRFWWRCGEGHEWLSTPKNRVKDGAGCPYCSGHRATPETSLATRDPAVAKQWHPTDNGTLTPADVTLGSGLQVWWQCPEGTEHVWRCPVVTRQRAGCPFCAGRRVCSTNSLAVVFPKIADEWSPTRNGELTAHHVTRGSGRMVWWRCQFGHEWKSKVAQRTGQGTGCPRCAKPRKKVAVTGRGRRSVNLASYEGAHHGPVRRVK